MDSRVMRFWLLRVLVGLLLISAALDLDGRVMHAYRWIGHLFGSL